MANNKCYFEKGQYYFGENAYKGVDVPSEYLINYEESMYACLGRAMQPGLLYVKRDNKIGVFTIHESGMASYGTFIFSSNIYPFIYDEVWHNGSFEGPGFGYVAVRIKHSWGVLRVEDKYDPCLKKFSQRPCMMIVPCIYLTRGEAISFIDKKLYHPEYKWRNPFANLDVDMLR